ncbi:MAG: amino acid racemase [Pyrinomonadaceae bacterium]
MKTLGIVGGIGPESTIVYYREIIAGFRAREADQNYPHLIINSISVQTFLGMMFAGQLAAATDFLAAEIERLERAGADLALLASNTPHIVFDELRRRSNIPLVSIVEATCDHILKLGMSRVALFGTRYTMQGGFYPPVFAAAGLTIVLPSDADQDYIHQKYIGELVENIIKPETRDGLLAVIDHMKTSDAIEGVILGGTELPLILTEESHNGIPLLDTAKIHAAAAVEKMF